MMNDVVCDREAVDISIDRYRFTRTETQIVDLVAIDQ